MVGTIMEWSLVAVQSKEDRLTVSSTGRHTVFISYARADSSVARQVIDLLRQHAIETWIDHRDIEPGTSDWEEAIREAIRQTSVVILLASLDSRQSSSVRGELAVAHSENRCVIPLWINGSVWTNCVPLDRVASQYIDCRSGLATQMPRLIATLKSHESAATDPLEDLKQYPESHVISPAVPSWWKWLFVGNLLLLPLLGFFVYLIGWTAPGQSRNIESAVPIPEEKPVKSVDLIPPGESELVAPIVTQQGFSEALPSPPKTQTLKYGGDLEDNLRFCILTCEGCRLVETHHVASMNVEGIIKRLNECDEHSFAPSIRKTYRDIRDEVLRFQEKYGYYYILNKAQTIELPFQRQVFRPQMHQFYIRLDQLLKDHQALAASLRP